MFKDMYEINLQYEDFLKRVNDLKECLNIESLKKEITLLEEKTNESNFWDDNRSASKILKKISKDKNNIEQVLKLESMVSDFKDLVSMISEEDDEEKQQSEPEPQKSETPDIQETYSDVINNGFDFDNILIN